jgi:hypothetical protein
LLWPQESRLGAMGSIIPFKRRGESLPSHSNPPLHLFESVKNKNVQLFHAFAPMLCKRPTKKIEDTVKEMGGSEFLIEEKLDGERIQLHKRGSEYFYCSRYVVRSSFVPFDPSRYQEGERLYVPIRCPCRYRKFDTAHRRSLWPSCRRVRIILNCDHRYEYHF